MHQTPAATETNELQLRHLIDAVTEYAIFLIDEDGVVVTWNQGAERIKGYAADEIIGKPYDTFFRGADRALGKPAQLLRAATRDGCARDAGWRVRKDGSAFWAEVVLTATNDGPSRGFVKITRDLTERHAAEESLHQSDALFRSVAENISAILWVLDDQATRCLYVNPAYERVFQRTRESLYADAASHLEALHPADAEALKAYRGRLVQDGQAEVEFRVVAGDGSTRWLRAVGKAIRNRGGVVQRFVGISEDVTALKKAEETLSRLVTIVESTEDAIVCKAVDGVVTDWNSGAERLYGYPASEIVGKSAEVLYPPESREEFALNMDRVRRGDSIRPHHARRLRKDGTQIDVVVSIAPLRTKPGRIDGSVVLTHDLTETLRLHEQFRQSQKMESVGRLAAGIAHDFNNLLTIIYGHTDMLLEQQPAESPIRPSLEEIQLAAQQSAGLTRQLLTFTRRSVLTPQVLNLNDVVRDAEKMLWRIIGEDVVMTVALDPAISLVKVDPVQIGQVLLNLAVNARDAMPLGGQLIVETKPATEATPGDAGSAPERYVVLSVSDTGTGMPPDVLARVFEPFFTTKEVGKGTGLGLSVVQGVVQQSNGRIDVSSQVGVGTTFRIFLPVVRHANTARPASAQPGKAVGGSETVLLIDDETGVRKIAAHALNEAGYHVVSARNGDEAIHVASRYAGRVDILVIDTVLSGTGGRHVVEELTGRFPGMKVLYLSGCTDAATPLARATLLQKPYSPNALLESVRRLLDQPARG